MFRLHAKVQRKKGKVLRCTRRFQRLQSMIWNLKIFPLLVSAKFTKLFNKIQEMEILAFLTTLGI